MLCQDSNGRDWLSAASHPGARPAWQHENAWKPSDQELSVGIACNVNLPSPGLSSITCAASPPIRLSRGRPLAPCMSNDCDVLGSVSDHRKWTPSHCPWCRPHRHSKPQSTTACPALTTAKTTRRPTASRAMTVAAIPSSPTLSRQTCPLRQARAPASPPSTRGNA